MPATEHRIAAATGTFGRTRAALEVAGGRTDSRLVFAVAGVCYLAAYLVTVGDLAVVDGGSGRLSVRTAADFSRAFVSLGFFRFDAIAILSAGPITYLFSPLNVLLGLSLGALVGANLALTYLGVVQPRACGLESSTGVLAGVPALVSGAACCGPTILLVVGVQASATIVTGFQFLVPIAFAMLIGSLLLVGRKVDPELL
jgi:pimeloyl-ACP methyl ester carboxylesterase